MEEQINILKELCNHSVFEGYDHIDEIKQLEFALQKRTNRETNVIPKIIPNVTFIFLTVELNSSSVIISIFTIFI